MPVFVLPGPTIVGIVVGVLIFVFLGAFGVWLFYKRTFKTRVQRERVSAEREEVIEM